MNDPFWMSPPEKPAIDRRHVHLWRVRLAGELYDADALLSSTEKARRDRFLLADARRRYVAARGALRTILSAYLETDPGAVSIAEATGGKPFLESGEVEFNVSHTGDLALIAVAGQRRVGVDVERERRIRGAMSIADRLFDAAERESLRQTPGQERIRRFFEYWTEKEARVKAIGGGVWDLHSADFSGAWRLRRIPAGEGFIAALVVEGEDDWELSAFDLSPGRYPAGNRY